VWSIGAHSASQGHSVAPNFKVSNIDKYEPKQDPGGWLAVYTTAAQVAGATEDVMTAYLPIVLEQDALQWLRHLP
jgi:sugar phosphate permease